MIGEGIALGEIPEDLGLRALEEIQAAGKMTPEIYRRLAEDMEERGLSHIRITPQDRNPPPVTADFKYYPKNPFFLLLVGFVQFIFIFLGFLLGQVAFGIRVKGRKNLKGVKGAITVSNHIAYLDPLLIKRVAGFRRLKITAAPANLGRGLSRPIMRAAGVMPFGSDLKAIRNFDRALMKATKKGWAHFYAEQSMWLNYPYPRPLRAGAFVYANKFGVPVVPIFYAYRKNGRLRRLLHLHDPITIVIGKPIFPSPDTDLRESVDTMKAQAESFMQEAFQTYSDYAPIGC